MGYEERSSRIVLLLVINDISEYKRLCSEHKRGSTADSAYTELHASLFSPCSETSEADAADATEHGGSLPCPPLLRPLCFDGDDDDDGANKSVSFN